MYTHRSEIWISFQQCWNVIILIQTQISKLNSIMPSQLLCKSLNSINPIKLSPFVLLEKHLHWHRNLNVRIFCLFQSKAPPSLWMCYTKAHWKMFAFGGVLKLVGDLATLVGPISITFIFDYIQRNLNAPSASPSAFVSPGVVDNGNNSFFPIRNMTQANEVNASNALQSTMAVAWPLPPPPASTPMINGNTEIYYPTWTDFVSNGWVMALVVLCASLAQGTLSQSSTHIVNMIGIRLRSSLQSLVYRKTLLISSSCFFSTDEKTDGAHHVGHTNNGAHMYYATDDNCERNCDVGNDNDTIGSTNNRKTSSSVTIDAIETSDDNKRTKDSVAVETDAIAKDTNSTLIDTGTIANLMSEDALNVMSFFWIAHYVWAIPLKVCSNRRYTCAQTPSNPHSTRMECIDDAHYLQCTRTTTNSRVKVERPA